MLKCSSCLGLSVIFKYFVSAFPTSICICLSSVHWALIESTHSTSFKPVIMHALCWILSGCQMRPDFCGAVFVLEDWKDSRSLICSHKALCVSLPTAHRPLSWIGTAHLLISVCVPPEKCFPSMLRVSSVVEHVSNTQKALNSVRSNCFFSLSVVSTFA